MLLVRLFWKLVPLAAAVAVCCLVAWTARAPRRAPVSPEPGLGAEQSRIAATAVNAAFAARWHEYGLQPDPPAPDLHVLRRLALALHGTPPSLEEIRQFEADASPDRLDRATRRLLADSRFADYFAERLARACVGTEQGQFIVFRRDRFAHWLSQQLQANRPYDQIVREMIAQQGLWTGQPATNFITAAATDGRIDSARLAGRTVRAFLGQRIDCAQCHDHPFDDWKQRDFEGLAAHFAQAQLSLVGVEDKTHTQQGGPLEFEVEDRVTLQKRSVAPAVPFHPEWLPADGTRREQLAAWVTHPDNRRFDRALVNRVWGLLFGQPYVAPVDDLPDPPANSAAGDVLDLLADDFRQHGRDLRRLIQVITATTPFRLDSRLPSAELTDAQIDRLTAEWAVFPLVRLRPEQVIGSMLQSSSVQTADQNSHFVFRAIRLIRENEFVREYGDLGDEELQSRGGTIPQRLLLMNGKLAREVLEPNPINATARLAVFASTDAACLEAVFLTCLTRRPTPEELAALLPQLEGTRGEHRQRVVEDICWSLFNATEFSWNH